MDSSAIQSKPVGQTVRFRRDLASKYLKEIWGLDYKPATLAKLACVGGGPRFQKAQRFPLYPKDELDAWASAKFSPLQSSTSHQNYEKGNEIKE